MNCYTDNFRYEKVDEILMKLFRKFKIPMVFFDIHEKVLFSFETDCMETPYIEDSRNLPETENARIPICHMGNFIGSLSVCAPNRKNGGLASVLAYCLENSLKFEAEIEDLSSEIVSVYEELSHLYSISSKMGSVMDVDTICHRVLEEADKILSPQNLSIMFPDSSKNRLYTRHSIGRNAESARSFTADISEGLVGHVLQLGEPVTACDIKADKRITLPYPAKSILCVPLITDNQAMGLLLACDKRSGEEFWSRELKLMAMFASEVAASIRKAQLYENNSKMFINTVEALATAIDAKDPYTYGHSKRVAQLAVSLCEKLGVPGRDKKFVELAALLHDIGKIGTPESILNKPGELKPEEFDKIMEHPAKGAEILSNIEEFSDVIKWIRHHHEWYDGKGYPDQIAAEHIPLEARIITVADAYDAMTSDRPYRKGMPPLEALKIMEGFNRSQFDPEILKEFRHIVLNVKRFADPALMMVSHPLNGTIAAPSADTVSNCQFSDGPKSHSLPGSYKHGEIDFQSDIAVRHGQESSHTSRLHADSCKNGWMALPAFEGKKKLFIIPVLITVIMLFSVSFAQRHDKTAEIVQINAQNKTSTSMNKQTIAAPYPRKIQQSDKSNAYIKFDIKPQGVIYVDGKRQGVSPPLKHLHLKAGKHSIVIKNKSFKPYRRNITIKRQEQLLIVHTYIAKLRAPVLRSGTKRTPKSIAKENEKINPAAFTAHISPSP
jgi:putative nucleotidyltransferase with HDIG domain